MMGNTKLRPDIQALRGLAVISVLLFHVDENIYPLGYLGVDVFFVISGFVVTPLILNIFREENHLRDRFSALIDFFRRRLFRLAPALLMMLFCCSIILVLLNSPESFRIFGQQALNTILIGGNYGAFKNVGDYFNNSGNPLLHTWSLAVEVQIYLFLPLFMFLLLGVKKKGIQTSFTIFAVISAISLYLFLDPAVLQPVYDRFAISDSARFSFYSPIHRLWQFTIGGLGFLLVENQNKSKSRSYFKYILPTILILFLGLRVHGAHVQSVLASFLALSLLCLRSFEKLPARIMAPLAWIGDRSYSIYLFHMPLIYIANTSPYISDSQLRKASVYLSSILSILIGAINYSMVENRFRINHGGKHSNPRGTQFLSSFLVINLVFSIVLIRGSENDYWGVERKIDRPAVGWSADPNCARMSGELVSACVYLRPDSTGTVLLVGDSHAAQFSQALVEAAQASNWNAVIWTMAGCNFVLSDNSGKIANGCIKRNHLILDWIAKHNPEAVVVSQYNRNGLPQQLMKYAVLTVNKLAPKVLVVGNTPIFPDEQFMKSPALFQRLYVAPKKIPASKMVTTDSEISDKFLKSVAKQGVDVVSLNSLWCSQVLCERFDSGWLFADTDHLSELGASKSVPYFRSYLEY